MKKRIEPLHAIHHYGNRNNVDERTRTVASVLSDAQKAIMGANRQAIAVYGGRDMTDPTLTHRLNAVTVPVLVLWGQSDRVVEPDYGRAYAAAIPGATYQPLFEAGHMPQLETPDRTFGSIWDFATKHQASPSA